MNKARFPGKSVNKHQRCTASYRDLEHPNSGGGSAEHKEAKSRLIDELPSLREKFGRFGAGREEFHGFSPNDKVKSVCTTKKAELTSIVSNLENHSGGAAKLPKDGKELAISAPQVRAKSKRIANRGEFSKGSGIKRKYPFEPELISPTDVVETSRSTINVKISDPFKTPCKFPVDDDMQEKQSATIAVKEATSCEVPAVQAESTNIISSTKHDSVKSGSVAIKSSPTPKISNQFFKGKEEFIAAAIVFVDAKLKQEFESLRHKEGLIQCGVCLDISESTALSFQRKNGSFLCLKCIDFLQDMLKIAKKAESFCCNFKGECEITQDTQYCEGCFVRSCLLMLDLTDDIYFKMWRSVPAISKNWVPPTPPKVKRYPNRGKVIFVNKDNGSILRVCPFKNKPANTSAASGYESTNGNHISTNGATKSRGVKRLFPNDDTSISKVSGARVKQVSRRNAETERPPRATFGDAVEILGGGLQHNMLLSRLENEEKKIKVFCPLESYEPEEVGYPVVVLKGDEPPKPLCFVCGSAGIKQLIFCSTCCEPFHPYCSEDELLLSAFIEEVVKQTTGERKPVDSNCLCVNEYEKSRSCIPCSSRLRSFRKWKCHRCTKCKICCDRILSNSTDVKDNEFLKCIECQDSYHHYCAKKVSSHTLKPTDSDKWMCQKCLKCTSCGVQLTKSLQNTYRKPSTDGNGNNQEREMLCQECFKRRQNGSFCPICLVCYDDNDWDSKMMECDKCARWIHATCERINDEQYFILSSLPESIAFVCRKCAAPELEVGWRQAVKTELTDGCTKILEFFQKKVVGMSRKRRVLNFDQEESISSTATPFATPKIKLEILPQPVEVDIPIIPLLQADSLKTVTNSADSFENNESILFSKYKLKSCYVKLIDLEITKHKKLKMSKSHVDLLRKRRVSGNQKPNCMQKLGEITPTKHPSVGLQSNQEDRKISSWCTPTSPTKLYTPNRLVTSFTDAIRKTKESWNSVAEFRSQCLQLLPNYFLEMDSSSTIHFEEYFENAIKQVFPWFEINNVRQERTYDVSAASSDSGVEVDVRTESPLLVSEKTSTDEDISESIAFEEIFWEEGVFMDYRECSLCREAGDFPLNSCGRLLYAGPGDWVHVNCAIWSSEVWEEDNGALQDLETALTRGKRSLCDFCGFLGATLNCCAGTCRRCYHFLCAIGANCSLMNDKTLFCPSHESAARGQIQKDMHVIRKVFVDLDETRKKDLKLPSTDLKIFIGCMRIDRLGQVVPISLSECSSPMTTVLIPVGYQCGRLFWSLPGMKKFQFYSLSASLHSNESIRSAFETLLQNPASYSIVIDHTKRKDLVASKFLEMRTFFDWVKSAPRFIDAYNIEWTAPFIPPKKRPNVTRKNGFQKQKTDELKDCPAASFHKCLPDVTRSEIKWEIKHSFEAPSLDGYDAERPQWSHVSERLHFPPPIFNTPFENSSLDKQPSSNWCHKAVEKIGLNHPGIVFAIEQLPGVESIVSKYKFKYHYPSVPPEDKPVETNQSGCARTEGFNKRKPFDMFGWLASTNRKAPAPLGMQEESVKSNGLPIPMRFRNLKERAKKDLVVLSSHIHGRGLFARRDIDMGEMLIEYAGEVIRSLVCDVREKRYEDGGMGCYMFRINRDSVIDATMKGNAARFINHSCEPNCESKSVKILGKDHILIFALKNIGRGEELTYDYKFEREADKLPCSCSSKRCRKFLN